MAGLSAWVARLFACLMLLLAVPALAGPLEDRVAELPAILSETRSAEDWFAPAFLAQVSADSFRATARQLVSQNGPVIGPARIVPPVRGQSAAVRVDYARARISFTLSVSADAPHKVVGLIVTDIAARNDSAEAVKAAFAALPGSAGLLIERLDKQDTPRVISHNPATPFNVASAHKLWILAEAARAVKGGKRTWSDVIPLGPPSLPSGITQSWPAASPMTLHSLATLMISISDNSATDTLHRALGRDAITRTAVRLGWGGITLPILTTTEAFALKMQGNADLREQFIHSRGLKGTDWLDAQASRLTRASINPAELGDKPRFISEIGWFAQPSAMIATLDHLRREAGPQALEIMAVNPGLPEAQAARFAYVGYKGGSEPGVVSMNMLLRTKAGAWYAVAASWNNPDGPAPEADFAQLVWRAVALVPQ